MDDKTFDDPEIAKNWMSLIESGSAKIRETDIYPKLKAWAHTISGSEILEIGCGQGACSAALSLIPCKYAGIDPSPLLIERAGKLYGGENRKFLLGNAYTLPFEDKSFDAAFSVALVHLLSDLQKAFDEMGRVLKSKGQFLIITANPGAYSLWTQNLTSKDVLHFHTLDEIGNSLKRAQLKILKTETFRDEKFILIQGETGV